MHHRVSPFWNHSLTCMAVLLAVMLTNVFTCAQAEEPKPAYATRTLTGRVVFMADALERRFGVKTVAPSQKNTLVLESPDGQLYPLVEDKRGHAYRLDKRLMGVPMELLVRQYRGSPAVQVIRVYELKDGHKYLVDYWCDICSITIFELKPCDCCQGPIRLRKRKLDASGEPIPEETVPVDESQ